MTRHDTAPPGAEAGGIRPPSAAAYYKIVLHGSDPCEATRERVAYGGDEAPREGAIAIDHRVATIVHFDLDSALLESAKYRGRVVACDRRGTAIALWVGGQ